MSLSRLVPAYIALLLLLAAAGAVNQERLHRQATLIERKADLQAEISELRSAAAVIRGPLAVGAWARAQGMVAAPEASRVRHVAPLAAPEPASHASGLEVRTIWR